MRPGCNHLVLGALVAASVLAPAGLWGQAPPGALAERARGEAQHARKKEVGAPLALPPFAKANEDCLAHLMLCGQLIESSLTSRDCALSDGGFGDLWFFPSYHRQGVGVAASSDDFAVLLGIVDPNDRVVDADSAPAGDIAAVGAFTTVFGNWSVAVLSDSSSAQKTGDYLMVIVCDSRCVPDASTLCLARGRYQVQVAWENQFDGSLGFGRAIKRSEDAGFFSFGDPSNVELLVKVLDFGDVIKFFYGQLTNLRYTIAVTDMVLDETRVYDSATDGCGGIDHNAFPGDQAAAAALAPAARVSGACRSGRESLCLLKKRFLVEVDWSNPGNGEGGRARAVSLSDVTGAFTFTSPSNVELVVKTLDFGDRIAVFYGALSNLEYTIRVTDTATGATRQYHNPAGRYCGGLDNAAF